MPRPKVETETVDLASAFEGLNETVNPYDMTLRFSGLPTVNSLSEAIQSIMDKVEANTRGAGQLKTQLGRIVLYKQQLHAALTEVFTIYNGMTNAVPKRRMSAVIKARHDMLVGLSDKLLGQFAATYIDTSEFILPDDRQQLINAVVEHLSHKEEPAVA